MSFPQDQTGRVRKGSGTYFILNFLVLHGKIDTREKRAALLRVLPLSSKRSLYATVRELRERGMLVPSTTYGNTIPNVIELTPAGAEAHRSAR
jgi:hypothetical protein